MTKSLYYQGKEYRFASYLGVKVLQANDKKLELSQGKLRLEIILHNSSANHLFAPKNGDMGRMIQESVSQKAEIKFFIDNINIFSRKTENACFEYVN